MKMLTIMINDKRKTLEITKQFEKCASIYGSEEYNMLKAAKADNPGYRVVVKKTKTVSSVNSISFKKMEEYIQKHDPDGERMKAYKNLRGTSAEAQEVGADSEAYHKIKNWFYKTYPEFAKFQEMRENLIAGKKEVRSEQTEVA